MTLPVPDAGPKKPRHMARPRAKDHGFAQLSLIEHALCPLDRERSLVQGFQHQATYRFMDKHRHMKTANAEVHAPYGLSANDEFYLWGLLALTFSEKEPEQIFTATPHFCLRQLGCVDAEGDRGGRDYRNFRQALKRLAAVNYANDGFWDPVRAEHRDVSFGFLSYSLPLDAKTSRAWRFAWNPLFFEFVNLHPLSVDCPVANQAG